MSPIIIGTQIVPETVHKYRHGFPTSAVSQMEAIVPDSAEVHADVHV